MEQSIKDLKAELKAEMQMKEELHAVKTSLAVLEALQGNKGKRE